MSSTAPAPRRAAPEVVVVIIGIDPHTRTHTASALDPDTHRVLASVQEFVHGALLVWLQER
jgi:hypothetical protein